MEREGRLKEEKEMKRELKEERERLRKRAW
jgi:hypothetical protein